MGTKQEVFNLIIRDCCPDDMDVQEWIISFDVVPTVDNPAYALEDAVMEYMEQMKGTLEEDKKITWSDIIRNMPKEIFSKHGLYRRDVINRVETVNGNVVPYTEEE